MTSKLGLVVTLGISDLSHLRPILCIKAWGAGKHGKPSPAEAIGVSMPVPGASRQLIQSLCLICCYRDNISPAYIQAVRPYLDKPEFQSDTVKKASKAAYGLCCWVRAMESYDK